MDSVQMPLVGCDYKKHEVHAAYTRIILPTIVYFIVTFGTLPLVFQVIIRYVCRELDDDDADDCDSASVSAGASWIVLFTGVCTYGSSILMMGIYSSLADVYGRKPVILVSYVGLTVYCLIITFLSSSDVFFIPGLLVASLFLGISGSYSAFLLGVFAYTSDATASDPSRRRRAFSVVEACIYIAKVVGPVSTGLAASYVGFTWPLIVSTLVAACTCLYVTVLPESLSPEASSRSDLLQLSPLTTFRNIYSLFTVPPRDPSHPNPLPYVTIAFILYYICLMGWMNILYVYVTHKFHWGPAEVGYYDSLLGFIQAVSMLCIPALFVDYLHIRLKLLTWVQIGYFFRCAFWCLFGAARSSLEAVLLVPLLLLSGPAIPNTRTFISRSASSEMQARSLSAFSTIEAICTLIAPVFSAGYTYTITTGQPFLMFEVMGCVSLVSFLIIVWVTQNKAYATNIPDIFAVATTAESQRMPVANMSCEGGFDNGHYVLLEQSEDCSFKTME